MIKQFIFILTFAAAAVFAASPAKASKHANLNTPALQAILRSEVPVVLLDARPAKFAETGRIPKAQYLSDRASDEQASKLIPSKNSLIITYCSNEDCPLSVDLSKHLNKLGYVNTLEYAEGMDGWVKAGNPAEPIKK
jgi:rhodanese-related sulfurtransferase